jgi:hypothetical protein
MRNAPNEACKENQNAYFMFNNFFFSENRTVYKIMWKNVAEREAAYCNMAARCMLN